MSASIVALNRKARKASREGKGWIEPTARLGLMSKGLTYILVGGIAMMAVFRTMPAMGPREALTIFVSHPTGAILLPLIGAGLWAYALWRVVQAACDPEHRGTRWRALLVRLAFLFSAGLHLSFGWTAFRLAMGNGIDHQRTAVYWLSRLLTKPWGEYVAAGIAIGIAINGVYLLRRAWKCDFQKRWKMSETSRKAKRYTCYMGQFGLLAQGVISFLIAWLLFQAAIHFNPREAGGVGDALQMLGSIPHGRWWLAGVSLGLLAYGAFALLEAHFYQLYGPTRESNQN